MQLAGYQIWVAQLAVLLLLVCVAVDCRSRTKNGEDSPMRSSHRSEESMLLDSPDSELIDEVKSRRRLNNPSRHRTSSSAGAGNRRSEAAKARRGGDDEDSQDNFEESSDEDYNEDLGAKKAYRSHKKPKRSKSLRAAFVRLGNVTMKNDGRRRSKNRWAEGGFVESDVPSYLKTVWRPTDVVDQFGDHKLTGLGLHLPNGHMLMHSDTWAKATEAPPALDSFGRKLDPALHVYNQPAQFNTALGLGGDRLDRLNPVLQGVGGSPFDLFKITNNNGGPMNNEDLGINPPPLEFDKNSRDIDCRLYGFSSSPNKYTGNPDSDGPVGGDMGENERQIVSWPVSPKGCDGIRCTLSGDEGRVCGDSADRGSPVLCGPQKTLTYVVDSPPGSPCTSRHIDAYHIGAMQSQMRPLLEG